MRLSDGSRQWLLFSVPRLLRLLRLLRPVKVVVVVVG
jgi:hypothetical protein